MACCCSRAQRPVWRTRSGLQPLAEAVGGVLTRRAGSGPFPVDPEGERSEFRGAESSRKSITPSMAEHGPRRVGRRLTDGQKGGLGGISVVQAVLAAVQVGATLFPGGGNVR
jgi:hypothetical protein